MQISKPDSVVIPLKRAGRLFFVDAVIDGESGNLVFDTGATGWVLNRTYFRKHVVSGNQVSSGITGEVDRVEKITVDTIKIPGFTFKGEDASLANLGHIENRRGFKVLGLFGFEKLKNFEVIIDFNNNELRLNPVNKMGNRTDFAATAFRPDCTQKIEISSGIVFVKGAIGGKTLRFCLDTGAETNAISSDAPKSVLTTITITRTMKLSGAGSGSSEVIYGKMNDFMLGDTSLPGMQTIITYLDHLNRAYGLHIDGVLGYDFLMKGTFCINFATKQMGISFIKTKVNENPL
jgi:predicted aspartyl protease